MVQLVPVRVGLVHHRALQLHLVQRCRHPHQDDHDHHQDHLLGLPAVRVIREPAVDRLLTQLPADRSLRGQDGV